MLRTHARVHRVPNVKREGLGRSVPRTVVSAGLAGAAAQCEFRTAMRFGLVRETAAPVEFWFEKDAAVTASAQRTLTESSQYQDSSA